MTLGEGKTPAVRLSGELARSLGVRTVLGKAELLNPTGSFKDRIAAAAVALAQERGCGRLVGTSSGNGGAALAAYAAAAGMPVTLRVAADAAPAKMAQVRAYGAQLEPTPAVRGSEAAARLDALLDRVAADAASSGAMLFVTAYRFMPEAMRAAEAIGAELREQAAAATAVYVPVGGGGLLAAVHAGLESGGGAAPRLVAVQPWGCSTVARALHGEDAVVGRVTTAVSGLQVARLLDADRVVAALQRSGGHAVGVSDKEVREAQAWLARKEGLLVEPAGATALAGALSDARAGRLSAADEVVLLLTGHGFKDPEGVERLAA